MLADGIPKIRRVAEAVGGSVRTLQRRLSDMNTTFSAVVNAAQVRAANELLAQGELSLTEITQQLGFSEETETPPLGYVRYLLFNQIAPWMEWIRRP